MQTKANTKKTNSASVNRINTRLQSITFFLLFVFFSLVPTPRKASNGRGCGVLVLN